MSSVHRIDRRRDWRAARAEGHEAAAIILDEALGALHEAENVLAGHSSISTLYAAAGLLRSARNDFIDEAAELREEAAKEDRG